MTAYMKIKQLDFDRLNISFHIFVHTDTDQN